MRIGSHAEYVEIEELERIPEDMPCAGDVNVSVALSFREFSGSYDGVWLELTQMERFISDLKRLDDKRRGSATISSLSPDEFTLEIRSSDATGHMEIEAHLHRHQCSGPRYWPICLKGGFEVQPDNIVQLLSLFKTFIN